MPKKVASVYLSFSWLNPLFRIGYRRKLQEDDMYKVLPEDASDRLGEELQRWFKFIVSDCTRGFCLVLLIESVYQFSLIVIKAPFFFNSFSTESQAIQSTNWTVSRANKFKHWFRQQFQLFSNSRFHVRSSITAQNQGHEQNSHSHLPSLLVYSVLYPVTFH